ncbi:MAG: hypothetical protein LBC09_00880, partial [Helicobacteraceae bacterium]|nr:hypothetical protein [Helicobacteraceae bacterium]
MASDRGAKKAIGQLALKTARGFLSSFARMGLFGKMGAVLGLCVVVINLLLTPIYGVSINAAIGLIFGLSLLAASFSYPIASFSQKLLIKSAFIAAALFL